MKRQILFMALIMVAVFSVSANGQTASIDYFGYAWETGGFPPSDPGDEFVFTGVADQADPLFGVNIGSEGTEELTFYMYDLISSGAIDVGGGTLMISYVGGFLEIYRDTARNAAWGIAPPNPTSPSTFVDGSLFFMGSFNTLTVFLDTSNGYGSYEGTLDGLSGEILGAVCTDCVYTWGGNFTPPSGAQIPDGYDIQIDGVLDIDVRVDTENSSWGSVKALYN